MAGIGAIAALGVVPAWSGEVRAQEADETTSPPTDVPPPAVESTTASEVTGTDDVPIVPTTTEPGSEHGSDHGSGHSGEPGTGNPTRMLLDLRWVMSDGTDLAHPYDAVLPAGWRLELRLSGDSMTGFGATSAVCTYPDGTDELECRYDTADHGDEPGLVVPGNAHATYDVHLVGVPADWDADPATLGTFTGREECPRGRGGHDSGGHDNGGHETDATHGGGGGEGGEGGGDGGGGRRTFVCTHTATVNQRPAPPPTTPTTPTTPATPAAPTTPATPTAPVNVASKTPATPVSVGSKAPASGTSTTPLPITGGSTLPIALLASVMLGAGLLCRRLSVGH